MIKKQVKVKPNAKKQQLTTELDGSLTAYLKSPPVDGNANKELVQLLATFFNVSKSDIAIKSGLSDRMKLIEIRTHEA
jgi:uncharacterized protein